MRDRGQKLRFASYVWIGPFFVLRIEGKQSLAMPTVDRSAGNILSTWVAVDAVLRREGSELQDPGDSDVKLRMVGSPHG